jgi:hypothetical protein
MMDNCYEVVTISLSIYNKKNVSKKWKQDR